MPYLIDTNVLARLADTLAAQHAVASNAVLALHRRTELLYLAPQVLIEFRGIATRPVAANGLGLSIADAEAHAARFEATFPLLPETPDIFPAWKSLVGGLGVISKQVHDARLVAICHVHAVTHLLTFNVADFARMAAYGPGITIVHPASV